MLRSSRAPKSAILRRAKNEDFDDIYNIWMQDHVIPFMTFERQPKEQFRAIFDKIMQGSDVYVIEDNGHVVATRRIIPSGGTHAHSVELASFGVDKEHLGKKYGQLFYESLIEKIKQDRPDVKRIEIGQETDNAIALNLAEKMGFKAEVIFPDWIRRATGTEEYTRKWNMAARFMGFLVDPAFSEVAIANVKPYTPKLPSMNMANEKVQIEIDRENNKAVCYLDGVKQGECSFSQGVRRFGHIQFWEINLEPGCDLGAMECLIRQVALEQADKCKKIEIYTSDATTARLVENLGFHCRGAKIGSCKIGNDYFNEIGVDLAFFNITDAKELAKIYVTDEYQSKRLNALLSECSKSINESLANNAIDKYTALYLENMAFQMVREAVGEVAIRRYGQAGQLAAPWHQLIEELPLDLKNQFIKLDQITTKSFKPEVEMQGLTVKK